MLKFFEKPQMINGRVIVGECHQWKSVEGDTLYILECTPIYWSEMNTPVRTLWIQHQRGLRDDLESVFNNISLQ